MMVMIVHVQLRISVELLAALFTAVHYSRCCPHPELLLLSCFLEGEHHVHAAL